MKRKPFNKKLTAEDDEKIRDALLEQTPVYIIAKQMNVDRHALANYIKANPYLMQVVENREESFKDTVEYEIQRKIVEDRNLNAMIYYADRKMRDRGYGEHIETSQTHDFKAPIVIGDIPVTNGE